ncbi:MAG: 2-hydroxyacyl-CoA dehydratase family protein [Oscillospiraceae bacterium]|nr:2-hydroxyacyl-CoA dehydratase family protein [Oscillospiraceae bacterium]
MAEKQYETRSVKRLNTPKLTGAYQKQWFMGLHDRIEKGEPFAFVGANCPMELLQAMDIPFVVNQWWTAICSAKQMGPYFYDLLEQAGYRNDICSYCAAAYACSLDPKPEEGPWGGLPAPTIAINGEGCSSGIKIEELMCESFGADSFRIQSFHQDIITDNWWEYSMDRWEELVGTERLDFYENELRALVDFLEEKTGRTLDMNKLIETLNNVNEQETYYRKTRDLIAKTVPAPVTVTDTVNAVMQAQWHRGTRWAVDMAKSLYDEVKALADEGKAAVPNEKLRLLWIGRGLWFNLAFYQHFEEKYGAAFVWTMYLAMGADSYIRNHVEENPLRCLAARFCFLEDVLHVPPFNSQWFVKEAKNNQIDGVVFLVPENCMNNGDFGYNIIQSLEKEGFPVCVLRADPADAKKWSQELMVETVEKFIEERVIPNKK